MSKGKMKDLLETRHGWDVSITLNNKGEGTHPHCQRGKGQSLRRSRGILTKGKKKKYEGEEAHCRGIGGGRGAFMDSKGPPLSSSSKGGAQKCGRYASLHYERTRVVPSTKKKKGRLLTASRGERKRDCGLLLQGRQQRGKGEC